MCLAQHPATVVLEFVGKLFFMFSPCHVDILYLSTASINCRFSPRESPRNGKDFLGLCPSLIAENRSRRQNRSVRLLFSVNSMPPHLMPLASQFPSVFSQSIGHLSLLEPHHLKKRFFFGHTTQSCLASNIQTHKEKH